MRAWARGLRDLLRQAGLAQGFDQGLQVRGVFVGAERGVSGQGDRGMERHGLARGRALPVYGDGSNIRDWLYVEDHCRGIELVLLHGALGETYNIGGNNELKNIDLIHQLCDIMDELLDRPVGDSRQLITFVKDRPGHDRRYAIDASKLMNELGWAPTIQSEEGLYKTAEWYLANEEWMDHVTSGSYRQYYEKQYGSEV